MSKANTTNQGSKQPNTVVLDDEAYTDVLKLQLVRKIKTGTKPSIKALIKEAVALLIAK